LIKQFKTLSRSGNIGKHRDEIAQGLYSYRIKKHVVLVREIKGRETEGRESEDEFIIIRVLHGRMDMEKQL